MSLTREIFYKIAIAFLLLAIVLMLPVEAKPRRHVQGEDTIKAGQVVKNGMVCKTQLIAVSGKARPTWPVNMAEGNAEALWQSTVTAIHGERFSDLTLAQKVERVPIKARFKQRRYVIKGFPCAPSL